MALSDSVTTVEGRRARVMRMKNLCIASAGSKKRDLECWDMYNEFQDETEFDYLRKVGDYELPARIRNVGKQRSKINNLVSQQSRRAFNYTVTASDKNSLKSKHNEIIRGWIERIDDRIKERYYAVTLQLQTIDQQIQELQQAGQQEGMDPQMAQQIQSVLPQYLMQLQALKAKAEREQMFTDNEIQAIEKYYKYDFKDFREQLAQKLSKKLIDRLEITQKSIQNFISHIVTGKQYYYVDYIPGESHARFEPINDMKVFYPSVEGVKWVQNGEWVGIEENWPLSRVKALWKNKLSKDDIKQLDQYVSYAQQSNVIVTPDNGAIFKDGVYSGTKENDASESVKVFRFWWKEERIINVKKSPNPHTGGKFTHFLDNSKSVLYSDNWTFKNGKYVHRDDKTEVDPKNAEFINLDKKEQVIEKCVQDRYRGVVLNDTIYVDLGLDPIQPRSIDSYYDVNLPVVGKTHSTITDRPYSLLWSTRDLQKLYKIIHYHRELLLAISGTRGNVIDVSQKPEDMSMKEWEYNKKLGRLYVQTVDKFGRKVNNSFNQWQAFDDTVTNSIQYLDAILESVDNEISDTMGMPRQRMGVTVPSDQVGTSQQSLSQSLLTTEILYYNHDLILAKALTQLVNLETQFCMTEDQLIEVVDERLGKEIVKIPAGVLTGVEWETLISNNNKDDQRISELKQLAIRQNDKGQISFQHLLSLWSEDSLVSLQKNFEYFSEKAAQIQQMSASQAKQDQMDIDKAKIQFQNEYDQLMQQQKGQIEMARIEVDRARLEMDKQRMMIDAKNAEMKLEQEKQIAGAQIEADTNVELSYLINQDKHETRNEELQAIQIQIEAMLNQARLRLDTKNEEHTHSQTMRKLEIDDKKSSAKVQSSIRN